MQFNQVYPHHFLLDSIPCPSLARHLSDLLAEDDAHIQTRLMISNQPELYGVLLIMNNDFEQYQDINLFLSDSSEQQYNEYRHYRFSKMEFKLLSSVFKQDVAI